MLSVLQRVMSYKISIAALIEIWLWFLIPYITTGLLWSAFNPAYAQQIETHLLKGLPAGAGAMALVDSALLWPVLIFGSNICPT